MILLESMCSGKIPVMFNLPYSREFTENGKYGVLSKGLKDMVQKLKAVHEDLDLETFSERVKGFARKKYDMKHTSVQYLDVYKDAANY